MRQWVALEDRTTSSKSGISREEDDVADLDVYGSSSPVVVDNQKIVGHHELSQAGT
jgi:hypothetical protein